jgi:hypothetical protein
LYANLCYASSFPVWVNLIHLVLKILMNSQIKTWPPSTAGCAGTKNQKNQEKIFERILVSKIYVSGRKQGPEITKIYVTKK